VERDLEQIYEQGRQETRKLLDANGVQPQLFANVKTLPRTLGLMMNHGMLIDSSKIDASSSSYNKDKVHDAQMHRTRKANQRPFGLKAFIDIDLHSRIASAAQPPMRSCQPDDRPAFFECGSLTQWKRSS
jgi:hypothetical protein